MFGPASRDIYMVMIELLVNCLNSFTCTRCRGVTVGVKINHIGRSQGFDGKSNVRFLVTHIYCKYEWV